MKFFKSTISVLRKGLSKTRSVLAGGLRTILHGRALTDEVIDEVEAYLIKADVGVKATISLISSMRAAYKAREITRGDEALVWLREQLKERWTAADRALAEADVPPTVILVVGANGVGKTTSVAKIAKVLRDAGKSVVLAAADTYRAGAVEQLTIWAERLGVQIVRGTTGADPASVAFDAAQAAVSRQVDVLLIDTAGRLQTNQGLMRQLTKIRDVVRKHIPGAPHEVLLVLDATAGQNAILQAQQFSQAANVTGIFLAKLDGTAKGGIVVAIRDELGIPVKLIGVGERLDDVEPFDPDAFIDAIFTESEGQRVET
jgi:fused signal recognition particle receptor